MYRAICNVMRRPSPVRMRAVTEACRTPIPAAVIRRWSGSPSTTCRHSQDTMNHAAPYVALALRARAPLCDLAASAISVALLSRWLMSIGRRTCAGCARIGCVRPSMLLAQSAFFFFRLLVALIGADRAAYSIPNFLIRYRNDLKVIPNSCAALVLL